MPEKQPHDDKSPPGEGTVQGEGDYVAARRFQEAERTFAREGPVERKAREAEQALSGPEADDLEEARRTSGEGHVHAHPDEAADADASDPHEEGNLDKALDDTFPASDPVSTSPGAD
ncbi:MAG: hypothetical protein ACREEW_02145 [Caulobacteraceae bacterium]